jgi:hypothetical protein
VKKLILVFILGFTLGRGNAQKLLTSWSQQNIENYTKEMYDQAQKLNPSELLDKNLNSKTWSEVFLTLNASLNNYSKDKEFQKQLAQQLTNDKVTSLEGTSRLIIWDRIVSGDIIFEGKGLVIDNDLFKVAGRANQILQNLTKKNFGYVSINSSKKELNELKTKWSRYLAGELIEEYKPAEFKNSKIPEITSLKALEALIISLQENKIKEQITNKCLKNIYKLDEMPTDKSSSAIYCDPDTYTFAYLAMLFGDEKKDDTKTKIWWLDFWNNNRDKLSWNPEKGIFVLRN